MPRIDLEQFEMLKSLEKDSGENIFLKLIQIFEETAPELFLKLKESSSQGDYETLFKTAHKLKSSCLNLGATKMASLSAEIEIEARAKNAFDYTKSIENIENEFQYVLQELNDLNSKH